MKLKIISHLNSGIKHEYVAHFENADTPKENTVFYDKTTEKKWMYLGVSFLKANMLITGNFYVQFSPIDHDELMQEGETYYLVE